jgi:fatty acid desaturase
LIFYFFGDLQLLRLRYRHLHLHHHLHRHLQEDCHQEDQEGVEVVSLREVHLFAVFQLLPYLSLHLIVAFLHYIEKITAQLASVGSP